METYYALVYADEQSTEKFAVHLDASTAAELQGDLLVDATIAYQPMEYMSGEESVVGGPMPFGDGYLIRGAGSRSDEVAVGGIRGEQIQLFAHHSVIGDWVVIEYTADSPLIITTDFSQLKAYRGWNDDVRIHFITFDLYTGLPGGYFSISAIRMWGKKAPTPVGRLTGAAIFWTNFRNCSENSTGVTVDANQTVAKLPYRLALPAFSVGDRMWFKVTLAAGTYRFHTTDSPDPMEHDTHIALFRAAGGLVAESDDVDALGGDYRSSITETLVAGTYYIAIGGFGAEVGAGFSFVPSADAVVPAGAVFKIEAV